MTEATETTDRITRLERLMEQQLINTAELTQQVKEVGVQIKEVSTQIKAQATFHDRFEQSLSATRQLIESNAKAIASQLIVLVLMGNERQLGNYAALFASQDWKISTIIENLKSGVIHSMIPLKTYRKILKKLGVKSIDKILLIRDYI